MRVAVLGAGDVGGYFGARLAQAGVPITFIVGPPGQTNCVHGASSSGVRSATGAVRSMSGPCRSSPKPTT